ncbi:MAG: rhodanese-like domain-containing protein [Flavobacteriales bacterium]|nr:rhodanese-like domain-containing protein [Flavobacteriales bacterium]
MHVRKAGACELRTTTGRRWRACDRRCADPWEFAKGHLPGALNHSYLSFRFGRSVQAIERDALVFVYCQTCHRSPLAARRMKRLGFRRVVDLKGGFAHWRTSVDPAQELLP